MQCPQCDAQNREERRFCAECGSSLAVTCPDCSFANDPGEKFCGGCGAPLSSVPQPREQRFASPQSYTPKHLAEKILKSRGVIEGECKQVTVLFADIRGSLELIANKDPEEARKLLNQPIDIMMDAVHRFEGTVNRVLGDGIMALFGAPLAHEDHAVRACYAALAMQDAAHAFAEQARRELGVEIQVRIGLNSGEVVVGSIGNDLSMDYDVVGVTAHLASRMEQLALPGTIRLTSDTLRLAEGFVEVKSLGPVPVKGLSTPIEVFDLLRASGAKTRLQTVAKGSLTRFVGRQNEMSTLGKALAQADSGHGQVVAVIGDPGVGKSRLFLEFTRSHRTQAWLNLVGRSVSYSKASAWFPIIDLLKSYFAIQDRDDARTIRERVTGKLLTLDESLRPALPAFLTLFDVLDEDTGWQALDPPQRRRQILNALKTLFLKESEVQPLILEFEDLHWVDDESQQFLDSLVESLPATRILFLINYRPEYEHGWGNKTYYTQCRIDPLPPESAEELLTTLLGDDASLISLKRILIERTEGNPFFLEESVQTLVETGVLGGELGDYCMTEDVETLEVPATVQGVLAARIDRLPVDDKQLLQSAAVVGKDVPHSLLKAISDLSEEDLRRGLANLQATEFLYETRLFPDLEYTFKHALTHDVTYGSLLQERRRALHLRIAEAIEAIFADRLVEQIERLAHHYTEANLAEQAIGYWHQAGQRAADRSAYPESIKHFTKGLELIETLPDTRDRSWRELEFQISLGAALMATKGAGVPEVDQAYTRARELGQRFENTPEHFAGLWGLWRFNERCGKLQTACELGNELLSLAQCQPDTGLLLQAHHAQWTTFSRLGEFPTARDHANQGIALYNSKEHHTKAFLFGGHDPRVCAHAVSALSLWSLGYPDQALASQKEALALARELEHPLSLALAMSQATLVYWLLADIRKVQDYAKSLIALATDHSFSDHLKTGTFMHNWAQINLKGGEGSTDQVQQMLKSSQDLVGSEVPTTIALVAETFGLIGWVDEGLRLLSVAIDTLEKGGPPYWEAELHRLTGELLLLLSEDNAPKAEPCFHKAIDVARDQSAKSIELRAATSLARLWQRQGKQGEASELLAPIYEWFTEGFDTSNLQDARALLDELE
jgi:class 3 adenylate cyclase/predicted ATPase